MVLGVVCFPACFSHGAAADRHRGSGSPHAWRQEPFTLTLQGTTIQIIIRYATSRFHMLRSLYDSLAYDMYEEAGEFLAGRPALCTGDCASGASSIVVPTMALSKNCSITAQDSRPTINEVYILRVANLSMQFYEYMACIVRLVFAVFYSMLKFLLIPKTGILKHQ